MRRACALIALLGAASIVGAAPGTWQDIIPRPKHIAVTGEQWVVAEGEQPLATIVVPPRQPKAAIGADEINDRMARLGGPELPVLECDDAARLADLDGLPIVISKCYGSDLAEAIIDECAVDVARGDPGDQGYVIRFVTFRGRPLLFLAGSDPQGALYAAVTFRRLLERDGNSILATVCSVRDWPDFKWRGTGSLMQMRKSYPVYGATGDDYLEALKLHVDWMLRAKLNLLGDYAYGGEDVAQWEGSVDWMREMNAYARERGIIGEEYQSTNVGYDERDASDPRFEGMMHTRNLFFTWSDDELIRRRAREIGEMWDRANLGMVVLHCPDGGGPLNPEMWNDRSQADRERWGNDRASADAHVFNLFHQEIKAVNPDIEVVFVIYPYNARYLYFDMLKPLYPELTRERFEWAGRRYFRDLGPKLAEDAAVCVWLGEPRYMDEFRGYFGDRPMYYWFKISKGWVDSGWLVTTHRHIGTNLYDNPGDIMAVRIDRNAPNFINRLVAGQFAWDTRSEGARDFDGVYYDFRADNDEPEVIIEQWGLRACRHMWGPQLGPIMHQAFNQGIIPALIVNPSRMLNDENRTRRKLGLAALELAPEMMLRQAEGCAAAAEGRAMRSSTWTSAQLRPPPRRWTICRSRCSSTTSGAPTVSRPTRGRTTTCCWPRRASRRATVTRSRTTSRQASRRSRTASRTCSACSRRRPTCAPMTRGTPPAPPRAYSPPSPAPTPTSRGCSSRLRPAAAAIATRNSSSSPSLTRAPSAWRSTTRPVTAAPPSDIRAGC